jgi:glutamyl-tRNA synthetase
MSIPETVKDAIRKYAIKNAFDYGKADDGSVIGKVIAVSKSVPMAELKIEVHAAVSDINKMDRAQLEKEYSAFSNEFKEKAMETAKRTERPNLSIEGAEMGKVVTRLPPAPTGYMHIGHVKQAILSSEVARIYNGKFYRYFDDTDPEKCAQEFVDAMMRDHEWLGLKFDKTYYASDFIEDTYKYARQMINKGMAYACLCSRETMKDKRFNRQECEHRGYDADRNAKLFEDMLAGRFNEGEITLRFKGDMKSDNTAMRDPVIMRISESRHYRLGDKYRVWPTYDFNTPVVDSLQGVTDVIRSKEYELRDELAASILAALGLRMPRMHLESRLNVKGNITQKREIRKLVEEKAISGWDDPRLMTIMALRRRGIMPEAIRNFALRLGMTKTDSTVPFDMLIAENRKVIDPIAKHLFFVSDPVKLSVDGIGERHVKLPLHPHGKDGFRDYTIGNYLYIDGKDSGNLVPGEVIRLKDLVDIRIIEVGDSEGLAVTVENDEIRDKTVQWVPESSHIQCSVIVPGDLVDADGNVNGDSLRIVYGKAEGHTADIKKGEIVQFERFGYCILDDEKKMQFIFISR